MRLGSLLVGGLIGAGLTMLLAPRSGQETQDQLRRRAQNLKDQYGGVVEQGRLRATELIRSSREMLDERLQQGQELVNQTVESTRRNLENLEPQATEKVDRAAGTVQQRTDQTDQAQM